MSKLNWSICCKMAQEEPGKEHTILQSQETIADNPTYYTYVYGTNPPPDVKGRVMCTGRNKDGELTVTKMRANAHQLIFGASGSCKTQGPVLSELANMDGRTSYIVFDTKGEVTPLVYGLAVEKYGVNNVFIANFKDPAHSMIRLNPFVPLGDLWLSSEYTHPKRRQEIRDDIVSQVLKYVERAMPVKNRSEPSWETIPRECNAGGLLALFEDLTLTPDQEKKNRRPKTLPHQINFNTVSRISNTFLTGTSSMFYDHGFFSKRDSESPAYKAAKPLVNNASNTRLNYLAFQRDQLNQFESPKIKAMSKNNTFDFLLMGKTPTVLFIIYDQSDTQSREYINFIVSCALESLLNEGNKIPGGLPVPVVTLIDEFPTLKANPVYKELLASSRGCNIYLSLVLQSLSQLKSLYPEDWSSMINNCSLQIFLGTNDVDTAMDFSKKLGQTTIPEPKAFLQGHYESQTVPVVTHDQLMHRMKPGECYLCIDRQMPVHGTFELFYKTKEYHTHPRAHLDKFKPIKPEDNLTEYSVSWLYRDDDEDDDFDIDALF